MPMLNVKQGGGVASAVHSQPPALLPQSWNFVRPLFLSMNLPPVCIPDGPMCCVDIEALSFTMSTTIKIRLILKFKTD